MFINLAIPTALSVAYCNSMAYYNQVLQLLKIYQRLYLKRVFGCHTLDSK